VGDHKGKSDADEKESTLIFFEPAVGCRAGAHLSDSEAETDKVYQSKRNYCAGLIICTGMERERVGGWVGGAAERRNSW
jgi:hypothetical protein